MISATFRSVQMQMHIYYLAMALEAQERIFVAACNWENMIRQELDAVKGTYLPLYR